MLLHPHAVINLWRVIYELNEYLKIVFFLGFDVLGGWWEGFQNIRHGDVFWENQFLTLL